jgi:hypothetical protein
VVLAAVLAAAIAGSAIGVPAAGATTVSTEAELRAAFGETDETQIDLAASINLDCVDSAGGAVVRDSTTPLTLDGHGFVLRQTCTEAESGVMIQNGTGALILEDVTITGGDAAVDGGGVFALGPVTVVDSEIFNNEAVRDPTGAGGGIASDGEVTVVDSSISSNSATQTGGVGAAGTITVLRSTISDNEGGGIDGGGATTAVNVLNSTVADNVAAAPNAGIFTEGVTTLVYSTVVRNQAQDFPNIDSGNGLVSFASVVAQPLGGGARNCLVGPTTSHGYNFSDDSHNTCGFNAPTDRPNGGNPQLGPLSANGGPTPTMLPLSGSPLLDAIPAGDCQADGAAGVTTDQRGVTRPQGGSCDVGAVEPAVTPPPPPPPPPSNQFSFGDVKKNKGKGTAKLAVNVPGPGDVELAKTKKVKGDDERAEAQGSVKLAVKSKRKAKRKLNKRGKAKVTAEVTYTPDGGQPNSDSKKLKLVKR